MLPTDQPAGVSRRSLLTQSVPALALAGATFGGVSALLAQDAPAGGMAPANAGNAASPVLDALKAATKDGKYALPPLAYGYDALEPHIDKETMTLHHTKHQQAYVDGLNKAIADLATLRGGGDIDAAKLAGLSRNVSFNAGGHLLHTIFFATMGPGGNATAGPDDASALATDLKAQYGSIDAFKTHFSKVAEGVKGSGWAIAFYEPVGRQILITDSGDQDLRQIPASLPVLLLDVWEHAFYLKYQNRKAEYVKAWWNAVNWSAVSSWYNVAKAVSNG